MPFKKDILPVVLVMSIPVIFFTFLFLQRKNYEFIIYIAVIILLGIVIGIAHSKINYPKYVIWWLAAWAIMHMSGGGLYLGGKKLYELMIFNIVGAPYYIFKYDQLVHIIGFFAATLTLYYTLRPLLKNNIHKWTALSVILIMAGLGTGALNEIIEFTATVLVPETGVGGYVNTSLDLVSDLIGAVMAIVYIKFHKEKNKI
jgi:hypothetical protein